MNCVRKRSPGTYKMESTGPKVLSRYLRGPIGSCHDQCKCMSQQTKETKTIHSVLKKSPKAPAERTALDAARSANTVRKAPSVVPKPTTGIVKNIVSRITSEPKSRDVKAKSRNSQTKTRDRSPRRRHSEIFLPDNDPMLLPIRVPKRRLSEIFGNQNRGVGSVSNASLVRGSSISKNGSRKDSKPSSVNKRSNHPKNIVSGQKTVVVGAKVPTLRSTRSLPKPPELKGSRKPKPTKAIEEVVPEKTLHVIEPDDCTVETTKSQTPISSASFSSISKEKVVQHECSPPKGDGDDTPATEAKNGDNVAESEDHQEKKDGTRVRKLAEKNGDGSVRFRRGKVLSPDSESNSPRKVEFRQGKELEEDENGKGEKKGLRRLSSDGGVHTLESPSVKVDLKHQEREEKEPLGLYNEVIEETASKLIQTRKSKVKALVGAFENITRAP